MSQNPQSIITIIIIISGWVLGSTHNCKIKILQVPKKVTNNLKFRMHYHEVWFYVVYNEVHKHAES